MHFCKPNEKGCVETERFFDVIVSGPSRFSPEQGDLGSALLKMRSGLSMNIVEQYNSFKDMPANFTSAFTEELFLSRPARLPTSTLRPNLGDGKGYYSNLYPPLAG